MTLKGNLRDFTLTQLLHLINLAQKTGTLTIKGSSDVARVSFREGKLAYSQIGNQNNSLASVLYRANKFSNAQYKIITSRAGDMSDKELGLLLINANYLSQDEILNILKTEFVNTIHHLFTWIEGFFQFEKDILPPDGKITLRINLENIIIEGSRKIDEWERFHDEIPSLEMALKFTDRPGVNLKNIRLSAQEWKVVSYINPKNSIQQIAQVTKMNDLEIRRIVYGLLQAGLVELFRPEGMPKPQPARPTLPVSSKEEQKSLIQRIIRRIRSL